VRGSLSLSIVVGVVIAAGVALAAPSPLQLRARLIEQGEFVGYRPESATQSYRTAAAWVSAGPHVPTTQRSAEIARLRREGFEELLSEFLDRGSERQSGLSWVMQLGSAAAARAELKVDLAENKSETTMGGGTYTTFSIPAIPVAEGYRVAGGGSVGENVFFADGPFLYLVGQGFSSADKSPPTRAGLIAAVTTLYRRVHGHPAG
jgi:hypothetical protein